jgi:hypothetical protein
MIKNFLMLSVLVTSLITSFTCAQFSPEYNCSSYTPEILTQAKQAFSLTVFPDMNNATTVGFVASPKHVEFWQQLKNASWQQVNTIRFDNCIIDSIAGSNFGESKLVIAGTDTNSTDHAGIIGLWVQESATDWSQASTFIYPQVHSLMSVAAFAPPGGNFSVVAEAENILRAAIIEQTSPDTWLNSANIPALLPSLPFLTPDNTQYLAIWTVQHSTAQSLVTFLCYDNDTWNPEYTGTTDVGPIQALAYGVSNNNNPLVVAGNSKGTLFFWQNNGSSWEQLNNLQAHDNAIYSATTFIYNNQLYIASGSGDQTIAISRENPENNEWEVVARLCIDGDYTIVDSLITFVDMTNTLYLASTQRNSKVLLWNIAEILSN